MRKGDIIDTPRGLGCMSCCKIPQHQRRPVASDATSYKVNLQHILSCEGLVSGGRTDRKKPPRLSDNLSRSLACSTGIRPASGAVLVTEWLQDSTETGFQVSSGMDKSTIVIWHGLSVKGCSQTYHHSCHLFSTSACALI
jgi:hypothetical protein